MGVRFFKLHFRVNSSYLKIFFSFSISGLFIFIGAKFLQDM